jgi:hydrogenase maturation protease
MNTTLVDKIVQAVLYEGYLLYPYRPCLKNQKRFMFGCLYPRSYCERLPNCDSSSIQMECLLEHHDDWQLEIEIRFLQLINNTDVDPTLQEAMERRVGTGLCFAEALQGQPRRIDFSCPASTDSRSIELETGPRAAPLTGGPTLHGTVEIAASQVNAELSKVSVKVENTSLGDDSVQSHEQAIGQALLSTHIILQAQKGLFVSSFDPPDRWRNFSAQLINRGTWPVLIGEPDERQTMLSSPIILYDHPQVAAESPGDLFDATEIDEILSLRLMTLTDEEKQQIRMTDRRAEQILNRTESLPEEQFQKLHGVIRELRRLQTTEH